MSSPAGIRPRRRRVPPAHPRRHARARRRRVRPPGRLPPLRRHAPPRRRAGRVRRRAVANAGRGRRARTPRSRSAQLAGMPLARRFTAAGRWTDPKQNCTHQFDAACHAITHAALAADGARLRRRGAAARSRRPARPRCRLWVDGELALEWEITWDGIVDADRAVRRRAVEGRLHALGRRDASGGRGRARDHVATRVRHRHGPRAWISTRSRSPNELPRDDGGRVPHDAAGRRRGRLPPRRLDPRLRRASRTCSSATTLTS